MEGVFSSLGVVVSDVEDFLDVLENPEAQLPNELIIDFPAPRSVEALLDFLTSLLLSVVSVGGSKA